jgi:predicted ATPase/transcriptional regulator with XRE-family HTH domain
MRGGQNRPAMTNTTKTGTRALAPFGELLVRLRAAAGLTQEQLAARAGLSSAAIAALESGKRRAPRFTTVELLATALGLDAQHRQELVRAARGTSHGAAREPDRSFWRSVAEPTPLVGRVHELDLIVRSLAAGDTRLLTLVGPAGVGKTRLALAAAARLAKHRLDDGDRFPDGVTLVDLTPVRDPDLVPGAIARALGLLDVGGRPTVERVTEMLAQRRHLVVLDNVEQVLPAAALPIADLLVACPHLALLVTSRVPLRLRWEQTLRVAPLPVPDSSVPLPSLDALLAIPSVALFVSRARARQVDFVLEEQYAPLLAQLVTQLDGLPLALELAAARLDVLPLPILVRRLADRLELLASQAPDLPERQRSLEAAVGWSYDLLSASERRVFRCLGVFAGQVNLDAIAAVVRAVAAGGSTAGDGEARVVTEDGRTLTQLLSLAENSLLLPPPGRPSDVTKFEEDEDDPQPVFALLETVREYAQERLDAAGELATARRAHAHYYLELVERAAPALRGPDQRAWYFRLEREHDNLRAALRWLLDQLRPDGAEAAAEPNAGLRLAGALGYFWYVRGYHSEGRRWLEEVLGRASRERDVVGLDSAARTRALIAAGPLLMVQAEYVRSRFVLTEALALAEQRQDPAAIAEATTYLGHATVVAGDGEEGTRLLQQAAGRWEALGDPHGLGETLFYLGYAADVAGDTATAAHHYLAALDHLREAGNAEHAGFVHSYLGVLEWRRGNESTAVEHLRAVLQTSVSLRDRWLLSFSSQATVALVGSRATPAAWERLLGAADALAQATGGATFGWEHLPGAERVAGLREQLARHGDRGAAYREGCTLTFAQVAALAVNLLAEARAE